MAFDKATRNRLAGFVSQARTLISEEFTQQFQSIYGIATSGAITPLDQLKHLDDTGLSVAALLRERIDYLERMHPEEKSGKKSAVSRLAREQAFTILNRLAAIRMAEKRGLIVESVGLGYKSKGFRVFEQVAGTGLGETYLRYRRYLFCLFDELAIDLGALFDRRSPQALLFPREPALIELLGLVNAADLDSLWAEDETIGWIYQYYNDPAERKKMREESAAPRNSRELAVRNQFFTPRYVVEFLTDNTLGRIWYEITKGETGLKDRCRYLVRRPTEVFLKPGETAPQSEAENENISQEELLKQPVYIVHRQLKDPRTLRMLDPACGSMHFGLYAFDLYEQIYSEAWDLECRYGKETLLREDGLKSFTDYYHDKEEFLRDVPRLIIEYNIHGVDIDPRAVQIAGLSLWLRAQKSWHEMGVKTVDRPPVRRSNIVCAEPMPGDKEMVREFTANLKVPALGYLVEQVFDKMQLAGEAGSLLKIEEEIRDIIADARKKWGTLRDAGKQTELELPGLKKQVQAEQLELDLDLTGITNEQFWNKAEEKVYQTLKEYAESAGSGGGYQKRLFAEDAARGFAFVDLCRKHYDTFVMNPPFGEAAEHIKSYLEENYIDTKADILQAFVERAQSLLTQSGMMGAITSRTSFFLSSAKAWRERLVLRMFNAHFLVDLGAGVLDAFVETAAYVLKTLSKQEQEQMMLNLLSELTNVELNKKGEFSIAKYQEARSEQLKKHQATQELDMFISEGFVQENNEGRQKTFVLNKSAIAYKVSSCKCINDYKPPLIAFRLLNNEEKNSSLLEKVTCNLTNSTFIITPLTFKDIPGSPFAYWLNSRISNLFKGLPEFENINRSAKQGLATADDFRYIRCWWETNTSDMCPADVHPKEWNGPYCVSHYKWFHITRGGEYSPYYDELFALINYYKDGYELKTSICERYPYLNGNSEFVVKNTLDYYRPGLTWPLRGSRFSVQVVPAGGIFSIAGKIALSNKIKELYELAGLMQSPIFDFLIGLFAGKVGGVQYESGLINKIPVPIAIPSKLSKNAEVGILCKRNINTFFEPARSFCIPQRRIKIKLREGATVLHDSCMVDANNIVKTLSECKEVTRDAYGLTNEDDATISLASEGNIAKSNLVENKPELLIPEDITAPIFVVMQNSYCVGCLFGRWDIRFATGERTPPPLPDPFDPLPVCPPGMLQNDQGLPAEPNGVPVNYPLRITWPGILVDDESHPTEDIVHRIREAIEVIWKENAASIEQEACEILGVKSLRDYFRKPSGFFADHLKRYSKSRRQAPIYWPLSTAKGSYTLWIYYHRLTDQTLHSAIADFLDPKLKSVRSEITMLRESGKQGSRLEELLDLEKELADFHDEIERIIKLPWKPNLNDGVIITASPLWKLFRLPKWQKDLKACWEKLEKGEYDWAHLAFTIWPDRVKKVCESDRSIAIAHDLEDLCKVEVVKGKRGKKVKVEVEDGDEVSEVEENE